MKLGKLLISEDLVLQWLQLEYGHIRQVQLSDGPRVIELVIEHDEMPEVKEGENIQIINLVIQTYQDGMGHKVGIRQPIEV